jgi:hypothetical protein
MSIWGCASPRFYVVIPGNSHTETGINVFSIPVWKQGDPVSIWGFVNPCYHTVIPGNPHIGTGIDVNSFLVWKWGVPVPIWGFVNPHYHTVKFWFLGQNFRWHAGAPVTQGKAKTPIPITIRGVPMLVLMGTLLGTIFIVLVAWTEFCYKFGVR